LFIPRSPELIYGRSGKVLRAKGIQYIQTFSTRIAGDAREGFYLENYNLLCSKGGFLMKKIINKINLKKNHEIVLIIILTAFILAIFTVPKFLNLDQTSTSPEREENNEEISSKTGEVEGKSNQSGNDSAPNSENTSNNNLNSYGHEANESKPVKGTTTKLNAKSKSDTSKTENPQTQIVVLEIKTSTNSYSYNVSWQEDMSIYDVLVSASEKNKFSLVAKWYGAPLNSYYISEIHGFNCQCWTYKLKDKYGNDAPGSGLGASLDTVSPGNIITWKAT